MSRACGRRFTLKSVFSKDLPLALGQTLKTENHPSSIRIYSFDWARNSSMVCAHTASNWRKLKDEIKLRNSPCSQRIRKSVAKSKDIYAAIDVVRLQSIHILKNT